VLSASPRIVAAVAAGAAAAIFATGCSSDEPPGAAPRSSATTLSSAESTTRLSPGPPQLARFYDQKPDWEDCGEHFECADLDVPLDYDDPSGKTITVAVNRRRAHSRSDRIGALLVNPGGPGGSGLDYARSTSHVATHAVLERYDLVGFDPRGVGQSSSVECLDDEETDAFIGADASPDTAAEEARIVELSKLFASRCAERSGDLLRHVSTVEAARDMDVLRAVLRDERLHYLGKSYGTYLGATYVELFPDHVGRVVLDGVVDPELTNEGLNRGQAIGFERALGAFVEDCVDRSSCPLSGSRESALRQVDRLLDEIDRRPLPADKGRPLTQGWAMVGLALGLYDPDYWPALRKAIDDAMDGDGDTFMTLADAYARRDDDGDYRSNAIAAQYAVNCVDRAEVSDVAVLRGRAKELETEAPVFGDYLGWGSLPCGFWAPKPAGRPGPVRAAGAAPILLVGTTRDPATPYEWAQSLAGQLESARLLTYDGDGHTAYRQGSRCVDRAVDRYLLAGTLPADRMRCG